MESPRKIIILLFKVYLEPETLLFYPSFIHYLTLLFSKATNTISNNCLPPKTTHCLLSITSPKALLILLANTCAKILYKHPTIEIGLDSPKLWGFLHLAIQKIKEEFISLGNTPCAWNCFNYFNKSPFINSQNSLRKKKTESIRAKTLSITTILNCIFHLFFFEFQSKHDISFSRYLLEPHTIKLRSIPTLFLESIFKKFLHLIFFITIGSSTQISSLCTPFNAFFLQLIVEWKSYVLQSLSFIHVSLDFWCSNDSLYLAHLQKSSWSCNLLLMSSSPNPPLS